MKVPDFAVADTPASGAARRKPSGAATVDPARTVTVTCSAGPGLKKLSVTTAGSVPGLASTRPGFEGSPATAGSTIHDEAGCAPVTEAWSETTPNVRRTAATSSPLTVHRTEVAPEVVAVNVRADAAGMLASTSPANAWGSASPRMSPPRDTRASSVVPALITTRSVRPASSPPGNVSVSAG